MYYVMLYVRRPSLEFSYTGVLQIFCPGLLGLFGQVRCLRHAKALIRLVGFAPNSLSVVTASIYLIV